MTDRTSGSRSRRRRVIFRVATPVGAVLLVLGQIGARTGLVSLPGDPHHVYAQLIGAALLLWGLTHWQ